VEKFSEISFKVVARIKSDFPDKFGIPRQSGLLKNLRSTIVFEPEFRIADALRGLEGFSHLWLL
jgi:tRNA (Thr-GGU) A37 N-methylase